MKSDIVTAAVSAILTQGNLGENFRKDFEKVVSAVYDAGHDCSAVVHESEPLTDAEIAVLRDSLRAKLPAADSASPAKDSASLVG